MSVKDSIRAAWHCGCPQKQDPRRNL